VEALKRYKIDIAELSIGEREYHFKFDSDFFSNFENSIAKKGSGGIKVVLNKTDTFIELSFHIFGKLELICDRSLDLFDLPLDFHREIIIKFGEEPEKNNEEDDIMFITWNTPSINIAQQLYEFLNMEIPMKKLHPRYQDKKDNSDELVYTSEANAESSIDPRWSKLSELKNDK